MWRCIDATGALKHASNYTSTAFHNGDVRNEAGQGRRVRQAAVVRHIAGIERSRNLGLLRTFLSRRRAEDTGRKRQQEHSQFNAEWVGGGCSTDRGTRLACEQRPRENERT